MKDYLNFSLLTAYHYCKYQVYLQQHLKISAAPTRAMVAGTKQHKVLEDEFLEEAEEIEIPFPELVARVIEGLEEPFTTREIWITSKSLKLKGFMDEVTVFPEKAHIVDDKPRLTEGGISQTQAYAFAFKESFLFPGQVEAVVRHRDTGDVLWNEWLTKPHIRTLKENVKEMHEIAKGKEPTCVPGQKCWPCRFKEFCRARNQ